MVAASLPLDDDFHSKVAAKRDSNYSLRQSKARNVGLRLDSLAAARRDGGGTPARQAEVLQSPKQGGETPASTARTRSSYPKALDSVSTSHARALRRWRGTAGRWW